MESIKILIRILKIFGWISIILAFYFLIHAVLTGTISLLLGLSSVQRLISGLVFLCLAHGLLKKEKWAWYISLVIFILGLIFIILGNFLISKYSLIEFLVNTFIYIFVYLFCLGLLIKGRQLFIGQPKERISQWFHKPYFVIAIVGTLILYIISGGVLVYSASIRMEVQLPVETEAITPVSKIAEEIIDNDKKLTQTKNPDQVVLEFYQCYIGNIGGNAPSMISRIEICGHFEKKFKQSFFEIDEKCRLFGECPLADHILWAQDTPGKENVQVADVKIENKTAEVIITFLPIWTKHKIKVSLLLEDNEWKISNIEDVNHGEF